MLADDAGATLLHGGEVELELVHLDAEVAEFVAGALVKLGGFEQRLGRDAARIETGAAEGVLVLAVLPVVYAGGLESVLRGADRGHVAAGSAADHDYVVGYHS